MPTQASVSPLLLRHIPLFAMLPEDRLAMLAGLVSRRSFPRGATIVAAGDVSHSLYVVISGTLKVVIRDPGDGREAIRSLLGPREYFGDMAAIDEGAESASVITLGPCELLALSKRDFWKCVSENAGMAMAVMRCLVERLRDANRKIGSLAVMDANERVAHLLMEMSEMVDGHHVVKGRVLKKDIAKMIGVSRETVSRIMRDLYAGGFIEVRGKSMYLRDNIATAN